MSESNGRYDEDQGSARSLADRLRTAIHAARGNVQIRERLKGIIADPERFDPIVRELGPRHALVRDLLAITRDTDAARGAPL